MLDVGRRVDYDRLWLAQMQTFDHGPEAAVYWNRRAESFYCSARNSDYASELMRRMDLYPERSVLDIGCGCGAMTLPLALRVKSVTALDISPIRIEKLRLKAREAGLSNITLVNRDWSRVAVGRELGRSDLVLLSRCVPARLSRSLSRIDQASKSACYLVWRASRTDDFEAEVADAIDKTYPLYPDYRIICGMLCQMGISARSEIFETTDQEQYPSLEAAALSLSKGNAVTADQFMRLMAVAKNHLNGVDGSFSHTRHMSWVLISWMPRSY